MRFFLESGRRVAVHLTRTRALWPAEERLVVFCHGAPGAGGFDPDPALTGANGVTLLSVDRPGYGRSDPVSGGRWATVGSAADDIAAVLDALHPGPVGVVGWSAGGRVALALAARRPDLVDRVVVVATPAPDDEVQWIDPEQRADLERLRSLGADEAHADLTRRLNSLVPADPFADDALWLLGAVSADEPALSRPGVRNRLGEMLRASFARGAAGLAMDTCGYCLQPWGFDPDEVHAETLLLYGSGDPIAGAHHGRWWRERLPAARLEIVPRAGHLVLLPMWAHALAHLAAGRGNLRVLAGARASADVDFDEFTAA